MCTTSMLEDADHVHMVPTLVLDPQLECGRAENYPTSILSHVRAVAVDNSVLPIEVQNARGAIVQPLRDVLPERFVDREIGWPLLFRQLNPLDGSGIDD